MAEFKNGAGLMHDEPGTISGPRNQVINNTRHGSVAFNEIQSMENRKGSASCSFEQLKTTVRKKEQGKEIGRVKMI